jgi:hypothetical protein
VYAHGGCPDEIPSDDWRNIEILISDGFIGNKAVLLALSSLTTGNLNSKMKQGSQPFTMKDVLPSTHEYIVPPPTEDEARAQAQKQLLAFMSMSPGAAPFFEA